MSENIKFTKDSIFGRYAEDDTGVMVGVVQDYTGVPCGVVRLSDESYVLAPFGDFIHVTSGS